MKIDVAKLINEVSKYPEIYNPDHKDFSNKKIRNNIFNTVINKDMNGINGEILQHKWDQILNKYANFIRKLSNDDSSQKVMERFMKWPWTKPMRIFKPYVRKQFQIPEFQSAAQLTPDIDLIPVAIQPLHVIPTLNGPSDEDAASGSEFPFPLPTGQIGTGLDLHNVSFTGQIPIVRPSTTNERISNANDTPSTSTSRATDTQLTHPIPEPSLEILRPNTMELLGIPATSDVEFVRPEFIVPAAGLPLFLENLSGMLSPLSFNDVNEDYNNQMGRSINAAIRRMVDRFPIDNLNIDDDDDNDDEDEDEDEDEDDDEDEDEDEDEDDDDNAADDDITTDEEGVLTVDDGPSSAKKRREQSSEDSNKDNDKDNDKGSIEANGDTSCTGDNEDDDQPDVLPDLPQPKPEVKRGPLDFSAQEHTFLAWAKTMSTFTARRQATIKMQINKIMSEAEFEDLDDEFFAANRKPLRSIYTSRY